MTNHIVGCSIMEGVCHVGDWKAIRKKLKGHSYEILGPYEVNGLMIFKYVRSNDLNDIFLHLFTEGNND